MSTPRRRTSLGLVAILASFFLVAEGVTAAMPGAAAPIAAPTVTGAEELVGQPFPGANPTATIHSAHGTDADGNAVVFWMTKGAGTTPAMLQVTNVSDQQVVFRQRVASGLTASAMVFSPVDNTVYIAMTSGEFYSWTPGEAAITNLGAISPGQNIASLAVDPDGLVFAGTTPGGLVVRFDPATGATVDLGRINPSATSVNSLSVDADFLYVGSAPGAELSRYNIHSGATDTIAIPASLGAQTSAHNQSLVDGHLLVRVQPANAAIVYDTDTLLVDDVVPSVSGQPISGQDPTGPYVYFRQAAPGKATAIYKYNLDTHTLATFGWAPNVFPMSFGFAEMADQEAFAGSSIVLASTNGRLYTWSQQSNRGTYLGESTLHGVPQPIQAVGHGPDGSVYVAGAALARIGATDAAFTTLPGVGQADVFARAGSVLLIGATGGKLSAYDTDEAWDGANPATTTIGSGQTRVLALTPFGVHVAVGSIAATGQSGAISMWDPASGALDVHTDLVPGHGIVSLAARDGIIYAGTTSPGASTDAVLFAFDPATGEVTKQVAPVAGATTVTGLTFDAAGVLWGIAGQELFAFDVATGAVTAHDRLFNSSSTGLDTDRAIVARSDGLYISADERLLRVDPTTWDAVMLADSGVAGVSEGADGNLYYARHGQAFRWNFSLPIAINPVIPTTTATVSPEVVGWGSDPVSVILATDAPRASIEYAIGNSNWQAYTGPVVLSEDGAYTFRYRSRALEGHVERTQSVQFSIDALAPTTIIRQSTDVVALTATDTTSGVATTEYRIDGSAWTSYTAPFRVGTADTGKNLEFRSTDAAGNVEAARTHLIGTPGDTNDRITDHGEQVQKEQALASLTVETADGTPLGIYIVSGNTNVNAEFTVVNLRTNENVLQTRLVEGSSSQRNIVQSPADGAVYFGTSATGHIYRYVPGSTEIEYLLEVPGKELVWGMDVGEDGTVWFGVYSSGKLYSLDPQTNVLTDHGRAAIGEQYIDAIEAVGNTVYVGTQASAKLLSFDRATGVFTEILMPVGHQETAITEIDVRGHLMFVSTGTKIHVRDLDTNTWVDVITGTSARVSPESPHDPELVYLRKDNQIHSYNLVTGELRGTGQRPNAAPESWNWLPIHSAADPLLMMTYWNGGRTYGFSMTGGQGAYIQPDFLGAGAPIVSLGTDTGGHIYTGAFLSPPGMGQFDPQTGTTKLLTSTSQVEGFGRFGDKIVFGRYPQGSLYVYDPSSPWAYGTNPKEQLEIGDEQSRPQVFVQVDAETMAVASVPAAGYHGGALTLWKPETGELNVYRDVVKDQTPVALVMRDGVLIGGTSINGGYGIDPVTSNATIFAWDPVTQELLWEVNPIPGARFIAGFAVADDGMLWAVVDGRSVIEFDPDTQEILRTITIDPTAAVHRFGENDQLLIADGRLFGSVADRLFHLDMVTDDVSVLFGRESGRSDGIDNVYELVRAADGDLYVAGDSTNLFSYALFGDTVAPEAAFTLGATTSTGVEVEVRGSDNYDSLPTVQTRIGDGPWQSHTLSVVIEVPFGSSIEYRVLDTSWNASPVAGFAAPEAPVAPDDPTLLISDKTVRGGDVVYLLGAGFPAEIEVALELRSDPVTLKDIVIDASGAFATSVVIPLGTTPGVHSIVVVADGDLASVQIEVLPADVGGGDPGGAGSGDGDLATTGVDSGALIGLAVLVLLAGIAFVSVHRRRASANRT